MSPATEVITGRRTAGRGQKLSLAIPELEQQNNVVVVDLPHLDLVRDAVVARGAAVTPAFDLLLLSLQIIYYSVRCPRVAQGSRTRAL